jgi:hypothetical protein
MAANKLYLSEQPLQKRVIKASLKLQKRLFNFHVALYDGQETFIEVLRGIGRTFDFKLETRVLQFRLPNTAGKGTITKTG